MFTLTVAKTGQTYAQAKSTAITLGTIVDNGTAIVPSIVKAHASKNAWTFKLVR